MSRVAIASYLRAPGGTLVPVEDWDGGVEDADYIEGVIELSIDGRPIMDARLWDYVDQLWAYIFNMLKELRKGDRAQTYFPDQPIALTFERLRANQLLVSLRVRPAEVYSAQVQEESFTEALLEAGAHFFGEMRRIVPEQHDSFSYELAKIEKLRAHPGTADLADQLPEYGV